MGKIVEVVCLCLALLLSGTPAEQPEGAPGMDAASLEAHFIDVGEADAALLLCEGHAMLIDGGNAEDSRLIYAYLKERGVDRLDAVVCTHAHEDHVGGLPGALSYARTDAAYSPVEDAESETFRSFRKLLDKQGVPLTVPSPGDVFSLGGARVEFLGPREPTEEVNNTSLVLRVDYGETSFLFTGDAEREEEMSLTDALAPLRCTVLKVAHHGSNTSTTYPFLYLAQPDYAVISVGAHNGYGHPAEAVLSRLRDAGVQVYRTDEQGTVVCRSDGKSVTFTTERGGAVQQSGTAQAQTPDAAEVYVLNIRSHVFHYPDCEGARRMSERNKLSFSGTREEAIANGYTPCGLCKP